MKLIAIVLLISSYVFASSNDPSRIPKSFNTSTGKAVFVNFTEANYFINYDLINKNAWIKAEIKFDAPEAGFPIFDSFAEPTSIILNGSKTSATLTQTPSRETSVRVVNTAIGIGSHTLQIEVPLRDLVEFKAEGVKSAFWTSDLSDRKYLERYMPANLEFDQVKMNFQVKVIGAKAKHTIYANGEQEIIDDSTFKISFPSHFTSSSVYFHMVPQGSMEELRFSLKSIDGRNVPVVVYTAKSFFRTTTKVDRLKTAVTEIFQELERDYGAFLHNQIIVYEAGLGGMEYCGATMTEFRALGHELFHSYFARGVMPANGNAGWVDEAFASWRDDDYYRSENLRGSSMMSSHPYYTRSTDTDAYGFGKRFMSYLDGKLKDKGGLKPFMRHMVDKKNFSPFFIEEFIQDMNSFYGMNLDPEFKKYTFGSKKSEGFHSDIHRKMSLEELQNHL